MKVTMNRLRLTFGAAADRLGWSDADRADIGADIRSAIDAGDNDRLQWWADRLEEMSGLQQLAAMCRAMEARIHAAAQERPAA